MYNLLIQKSERQILCRYWNAGNRHVSSTEAMALALRCPSLAPYQVGVKQFKKSKTFCFKGVRILRQAAPTRVQQIQVRAYCLLVSQPVLSNSRHLKDAETLAKEMTMMLNKLKEVGSNYGI